MVWPLVIIVVIIIAIALYYIYKPNLGGKNYPLNRYCLGCHKRFPDNLKACPNCGEPYFADNQK